MWVSGLLIGEDSDTIQATEAGCFPPKLFHLRLRREGAAIIIAPHEVRHLVDALVEAATRVVDEQVGAAAGHV